MSSNTNLHLPTIKSLREVLKKTPASAPLPFAKINKLSEKAYKELDKASIPTLRDEEWRFTNLAPLHQESFELEFEPPSLTHKDIEPFRLDESIYRMVFVDGIYAPELSSLPIDGGVTATDLATAMEKHGAAIESSLGEIKHQSNNIFTTFNTAFFNDAAVILVPRNITQDTHVHLLFITTQNNVVSNPRCLILVGEASKISLIEDYVSLQGSTYLVNPVTEIKLADQAQLMHVRLQRDSQQAFHIANCAVSVGPYARYRSISIAAGAKLSRYQLSIALEENAECAVDGLAIIDGNQVADTHSYIDHMNPNGTSRQLQVCIANSNAQAVFKGKVIVRALAQGTNAAQSSRNLLLNSHAQINTQPQLEIYADDVKCTHGATVGQLDSEEIFYLRSRGLSDSAARKLLTYAFGAEIINEIPVESIKYHLQQLMLTQTESQL